ncbi:MAG: AIM24 family protein [Rubrimonas sp.]
MAEFTVREIEGMRQLRIDLRDECVRSVRGALSRMEGAVRMTAPLPAPDALLKSWISSEAAIRPRYSGTGTVHLRPSMRGFHVFEARSLRWILEPGVFWASEGEVDLGLRLERMIPSMWAGEGLINLQTTVSGEGRIAINAPGPVEEIEVDGELVVRGRQVLGRTEGLRFSVRRPAGYVRSIIAGEKLARVFTGEGKALVCWTSYWNQYMHDKIAPDSDPTGDVFR